ncbi:hypothetical protein [Christiangramia forsetii]|uniref:Uncharacterized protein n=2 Tax=Christiangramia forsetii TaxID=411153 RepID=A0LZA6_CHRFK|nr:hypothetical protein [Christiangramia forsetii]GGG37864.1 hypothetical protein GCM10011532_21930 [Christiangramia forsetii]CAL65701.1 hypothetical protein GFO_0724 [Christiangramia forsetii KT0803]
MITNIQEHHNEEEIQLVRFQSEVVYWKGELAFISQEIKFYLDLLNSSLILKTNANYIDANYLSNQFFDLQETNDLHLKSCEGFQHQLMGQNECDQIECDHAFITAHLLLRSKIEKHIIEVRDIKQSAFIYLKDGIEKFIK